MAENAQEQILGYLLDALEDDERRQLQQELADDPQLREQLESLRAMLSPMDATREPIEPPPGLAQRTCRFVAACGSRPAKESRPAPAGRLHAMQPDTRLDGGSPSFGWLDVVAAAAILVAASLLIFPALQNSRVQARSLQCADNLRTVYQGLARYADSYAGYLPSAPPNDRLAVGGGFAPVLVSTGYLKEPRRLICPASAMSEVSDFSVPYPEEIRAMPEGDQLERTLKYIGGSYTMSLGYRTGDEFHGLRSKSRNDFALIAEAPDRDSPNFASHNHAGGRNVLFEDGSVRYTPVSTIGNDHIFLNADDRVGLGLHAHDSVIPPAGRLPLLYVGNYRW